MVIDELLERRAFDERVHPHDADLAARRHGECFFDGWVDAEQWQQGALANVIQ
tara:strand:- start:505 stop:663 length:159 start_codon:yes stop_codon:yes gene_type:complete